MFQINSINENKNHNSCIYFANKHLATTKLGTEYQSSQSESLEYRKKMHRVLTENFQLKEMLIKIQNQIKIIEDERSQLRQQLKLVLQEINYSDKKIDYYQEMIKQHQQLNSKMEEELENVYLELKKSKRNASNIIQHNQNLQSENKMISEMKTKYSHHLSRAKIQIDYERKQSQKLVKQNDSMLIEIKMLLEDVNMLEEELQAIKNEIEEYESYTMQKINQVKNGKEIQKWKNKWVKQKKKSSTYKQERDELVLEFQRANIQIGSNTLRKYFGQLDFL